MFRKIFRASASLLLCTTGLGTTAHADGGVLHIYTWADYIAPDLMTKFTKETGIKVTTDEYDSNDALLAKLQAGASGYDIAIPTSSYVGIMAGQGLLEDADVTTMPNYKYVDQRWRKPAWDPQQKYTVPWEWGTTSIAYMAAKVPDGFSSWKDLFQPTAGIMGKIQLTRAEEGMPELAEIYLSLPFCTTDIASLKKVQAAYLDLKPSVKIFDDSGMGDHMADGETVATLWYSGNAFQARVTNMPDLRYAFPKEGVLGWFDNLVIPKGAPDYDNARKFMNFVMDPKNIAIEANYAGDSDAVSASKPFLDPKVAAAPELTVPPGVPVRFMSKCSPTATKLANQLWASILQ